MHRNMLCYMLQYTLCCMMLLRCFSGTEWLSLSLV